MAAPPQDFLDRRQLGQLQQHRLAAMLDEVLPRNPFYARKLTEAGLDGRTRPADLAAFSFTTKSDLARDQEAHPPYGTILTYPLGRYCRLHQTSGTLGKPLRWLDTPQSWNWFLDCWEQVYGVVGLRPDDRLFFPFSFGPFLGFWGAFEAALRRGNFCLSGGGMSSSARLRCLLEHRITVVLCTPTYALRLAEVAREEGIDLAGSEVRAVLVAGEPGGSIAATRRRIESAWGARVFDHSGLTEVGAMGVECQQNPAGLHLLEADFVVEVLEPGGQRPVAPGEVGELVLTNLGRWASPAIRYRTGDLARVDPRPCACGRSFLRLEGGILGRADDMILLRGNNVYPSAVEAVVRRFPEVAEFRIVVDQSESLPALRIELEPAGPAVELAERVGRAIRDELFFRPEVTTVSPGTLPRFELKARRILRCGTRSTEE
jgi:phenylacetate-CoA ligase